MWLVGGGVAPSRAFASLCRWVWGGNSCLCGEQGLVSLGRGQAPHLPPYAHCPLQVQVSAYLPSVRWLHAAQTHCIRGHWCNVEDPGEAACALESSVLAGVVSAQPAGARWGPHIHGAFVLMGPCPFSMLALPRPKGYMQVRYLFIPGYVHGPSGKDCQAWEGMDTCEMCTCEHGEGCACM